MHANMNRMQFVLCFMHLFTVRYFKREKKKDDPPLLMRGNLGGERSESKNGPETQRVILSRTLSVRARTTKNYLFDKKPLLKSSKKEDDCTNFYQNRTFYERVTPKSKFDRYTSPCFDILRNLLAPGGGTDRFQRLDISYEVGASAAMM